MNLSKTLIKTNAVIIVILTGFALSPALPFNFISESSIQSGSAPLVENAVAPPKQEQARSGLPMRLKIPKINVVVAVKHVGLTSDGAMDVPKDLPDVAWFNLGPRPGEKGNSVIAGHYGWWENGIPAVFNNLYKLHKGDKVYVEDEKGATTTFVVREIRRYDPEADASAVFGSNDGKPHLNLITCEGVWDKVSRTYSKRLVVFTDKK